MNLLMNFFTENKILLKKLFVVASPNSEVFLIFGDIFVKSLLIRVARPEILPQIICYHTKGFQYSSTYLEEQCYYSGFEFLGSVCDMPVGSALLCFHSPMFISQSDCNGL